MTLHLVFNLQGLESCLQRRQPADPIVLMGDGTYALSQSDIECFVLREDAAARGITSNGKNIHGIDYAEFVQLSTDHNPVVSWAD